MKITAVITVLLSTSFFANAENVDLVISPNAEPAAVVAQATTPAPATPEVTTKPEDAKSDISDKATHLICKNKDTVRTIRIDKTAAGGCETIYTKNGKDSQEAESSTLPKCLKVLHGIRANLEKADWKCRDISQSRVSSSEAP